MGWMDSLYETYENSLNVVGIRDEGNVLLPIGHSIQNAQIEVTLSMEGTFLNARLLDKNEAETIIPVTEDSATRGSGIAPNPLHDQIKYVAGDYKDYSSDKKAEQYYEAYIEQLQSWCESEYGNGKVRAVYQYLRQGTLIKDLIQKNILVEKDGILDPKVKLQNLYEQEKGFVRFRIDSLEQTISPFWEDMETFNDYSNYNLSRDRQNGICYITGELTGLTYKHPAKVRGSFDKSKLISANDEQGFTYRGRFLTKNQAAGVSYMVSQKAHNALKWLLQKQGYIRDGMAVVAWESCNKKLPDIMADSLELWGDEEEEQESLTELVDTNEEYGKRLRRAIMGYSQELDVKSKVMVISLNSATPGRLSILYYREIAGSDFLKRIENWHLTCRWIHNYRWKDDRKASFVGAPSLRDIVLASLGTEQGDRLKVSEPLMQYTVGRLLPCVVDGARIPYDLVRAAYNRAISPLTMKENNWNKVLTIACSLVRKYRYDRYKEEWSMDLDTQCMNYDYLCGRLLAVADEIEQWALYEMHEDRQTNAKKYFNQFAKHPCKVWKTINANLQPYEARLGGKIHSLLEIKQEISSQIDPEQFRNLRSLDGTFILGFDTQKREFQKVKQQRKADKEKTALEQEVVK